ncbi:oligopeptide transporter subunit; ATP-binding component of ABC superfamily [uncultured Spirochaetota bacterium]|jgi:oligopeptide/dipeptide ABC transporter ATP-binding protein|uniref:Oligopeptide transporter subunit ATP-binding component of ABC superfamily n=1 Tax=uncultured Spirochaetota bacterium TaxID=460511 RepID=A0A652ZXD3_9SPIR|nr:oligopeptide transporter subunit; ATP-binding component of ABC superfamily [uncultured Spirochaetota bacterium]
MREDGAILEVKDLVKHFPSPAGSVKAVDGISFSIQEGETLGMVGESGCGKSTTGKVLIRLEDPTSGSARFENRDIFSIRKNDMKAFRRKVQIVFQDPFASLDPRMTVGEIIGEPLLVHKLFTRKLMKPRVRELLKMVGLDSTHIDRYPHEFSGGQRQRIGIARALAVEPRLIICDEPVSALDVSIQAQIINLLKDLQRSQGLTYLFIAHDLSVVKHISDRICVMYLGKIVETADKRALFDKPLHPYTQALLSSIPVPNPDRQEERILLEGDAPSPVSPPAGCRFHTRCVHAFDLCKREVPPMLEYDDKHFCACHFLNTKTPG